MKKKQNEEDDEDYYEDDFAEDVDEEGAAKHKSATKVQRNFRKFSMSRKAKKEKDKSSIVDSRGKEKEQVQDMNAGDSVNKVAIGMCESSYSSSSNGLAVGGEEVDIKNASATKLQSQFRRFSVMKNNNPNNSPSPPSGPSSSSSSSPTSQYPYNDSIPSSSSVSDFSKSPKAKRTEAISTPQLNINTNFETNGESTHSNHLSPMRPPQSRAEMVTQLIQTIEMIDRTSNPLSSMWEIIADDFSALDAVSVKRFIRELGVDGPKDLFHCDAQDIEKMSTLMKKTRRKLFLSLYQEHISFMKIKEALPGFVQS